MAIIQPAGSKSETVLTPYQIAMERVRTRWRVPVFSFCGIIASFIVPGIALCKVLSLGGIVWAITGTTLFVAIGFWFASWLMARSSGDDPRVLDLQLSGVLTIAAGLLWMSIAVQSGPVVQRMFEFWPTVAIIAMAIVANAVLAHRHAMRVA